MSRIGRVVSTWRVLLGDPGLRRLALDPRASARWATVWESRAGRGVGPLRRTPRATCATCSSSAPLVVGSAYDDDGRPTHEAPACRRHVEQIAMGRLAETGARVSSYPSRRTWRVWWRSAPVAVAWRNAAAQIPRTGDDLLPVTETAPPLSAQLFRERPSLW